jgi:hypothetical protein
MPTNVEEQTEVVDAVYKNLDKLAGLSKHSETLVQEIYTDLIKWLALMQEIIHE